MKIVKAGYEIMDALQSIDRDLGKIIAVDFDGTLCKDQWPEIGLANWELIHYLIKQRSQGAKVILWTCRTEDELFKAILWCKARGLHFDAVNDNIPEIVMKLGGNTRKVFATEYIDDKMSTRFKLPFDETVDFSDEFVKDATRDEVENAVAWCATQGLINDVEKGEH